MRLESSLSIFFNNMSTLFSLNKGVNFSLKF
jgi:hypothetical protein